MPRMEFHPRYGSTFPVESDPVDFATIAQAIVTAFSAIEELDLQVKASAENPSRHGKKWNPKVLCELETRLQKAGIDFDEPFAWTVRGGRTRIERDFPPLSGERASWSQYGIRDRSVSLVDAISYAGLLRSGVSAHRISRRTRSLRGYDVHNVQDLARRLILETMGFWRVFA